MGVDFLDRRVLAKRAVDGRKPASGHESQLRQGVASGHPQGRSAAKEPQSGLTRRNPLTFDPTCCGFSHSLFAIYARFYAAVNTVNDVRKLAPSKPAYGWMEMAYSATARRRCRPGANFATGELPRRNSITISPTACGGSRVSPPLRTHTKPSVPRNGSARCCSRTSTSCIPTGPRPKTTASSGRSRKLRVREHT